MKNSHSGLTLIYVFLLLPIFSLYDFPVSAKELEISFSYDIPPFVMNKGIDGLEPEIVREALKYKGHTFKVKQCSYKELGIAVAKAGLDAAAAVRKTDDGTYYSDNFIAFENYAITKKKSGITINSISDLKNKSIVIWQNAHRDLGSEFKSIFSPSVKEPYMKKYHEIPVQENQVRLFWTEKGEVIIIDKSIFIWFTKQLGSKFDINDKPVFHKIFPVPTEFQVNFKNKKIRDDFNEGLRHIRRNGVYQQIFDKYLK